LPKKKQKEEEQKRKEIEKARKSAEREEKHVHNNEKERVHKAAWKEALKAQRCKAKTASAFTHKHAIEHTVLSQGSSAGAKLTVDNTIFTDLCCVCFGSMKRMKVLEESGYSALVTDGSIKTVY